MGTQAQHQMERHLDQGSLPTDHQRHHQALLPMEYPLALEYHRMGTQAQLQMEHLLVQESLPTDHQHKSSAHILDLTRNQRIVHCGKNCKALSQIKGLHLCLLQMASLLVQVFHQTVILELRQMESHLGQTSVQMVLLPPHLHHLQMSKRSDASMQITQLCHPPYVTFGVRSKSTVI